MKNTLLNMGFGSIDQDGEDYLDLSGAEFFEAADALRARKITIKLPAKHTEKKHEKI
jgi:hypothetical protein